MPTKDDLRYFQKLPLDLKVMMTKARIDVFNELYPKTQIRY